VPHALSRRRDRPLESPTGHRPRYALVAHHPRRAGRRNAVARCVLSGLRDQPGDRSTHGRSSPTRLGRHAGSWTALLMVSGIGADAEAARTLCPPASQSPGRRSMKTFGAGGNRQPSGRRTRRQSCRPATSPGSGTGRRRVTRTAAARRSWLGWRGGRVSRARELAAALARLQMRRRARRRAGCHIPQ
jgi:hypothetical protein